MNDIKLCITVNSISSFQFGHRKIASHSVSKTAPTRLLNWTELKKVVEPNLSNYKEYGANPQLHHSDEEVIATYVHMYCVKCTMDLSKQTRRLNYCERNLHYYYLKKDRDPIDEQNRRKQISYVVCKLQQSQDALKRSSAPHISSEGTNTFLSNETNVRAAISTYYLGTGPRDIGNSLTFYGIPGGHSFHGLYYENMDEINEKVLEICEDIVQDGLVEEIKGQIKTIGR